MIATYRREAELRRLLRELQGQTQPLAGVVVADNAAEEELQRLIANRQSPISSFQAVYLPVPGNPGCGAGLKAAEEEALRRFPELTHVWILDDDAVPPPDCLAKLLAVLEAGAAELAAPLLSDSNGKLWAFPEPLDVGQRRVIRSCETPGDALKKFGAAPHRLCWCTGTCLLVTRLALETSGLHRDDFWMLGEDLEFSMRISARMNAVFSCGIVVPHLPPEPPDAIAAAKVHRAKFLALLQNLSYLGFRKTHGFHMRRYVAGNIRRYFRTFGFSRATFTEAGLAFWHGAVLGEPAGKKAGKN